VKGLTASKLGIARACPAFVVYPHVDTPTQEADDGTERHAEQEAAIVRGDVPAAYVERWPGLTWRAEVAFAVDVRTGIGRELGVGTRRDYSAVTEHEIAGTADAVGIGPTSLVVVDKKSFDPSVPRADVNAQVHVAALALCSAHGRDSADVAIDHALRPLDVASLDVFDLEAFLGELRAIAARVQDARDVASAGTEPRVAPGPHCRWCPALHYCPATRALKAEIEHRADLVAQDRSPVGFLERDEDAADAYEFAERVRILLKRLDAALYARAKDKPIPLRDGRVFGPRLVDGKEKLDGDITYAVVRELHGQGIADAAVIRTATKARIKEALDFAGVPNKAAAEREIYKAVKDRGGSKKESTTRIEAHDPQKQLKESA